MWSPHDGILKASYGKRKRGREKMSRKGSGRKREREEKEGRDREEEGRKTGTERHTYMFLVSCCVLHAPPQNSAIINMASTLELQKPGIKVALFS